MKKWVPDYSNISNTNLWTNQNNVTTTITETGFISYVINGYRTNTAATVELKINGNTVASDTSEARNLNGSTIAAISGVIPVSTGDVVSAHYIGNAFNARECYFIPGKWA